MQTIRLSKDFFLSIRATFIVSEKYNQRFYQELWINYFFLLLFNTEEFRHAWETNYSLFKCSSANEIIFDKMLLLILLLGSDDLAHLTCRKYQYMTRKNRQSTLSNQMMNTTNFMLKYKPYCIFWASLVVQLVKNPLAMWETWVWSLGWEDPLKKAKATHSSILS